MSDHRPNLRRVPVITGVGCVSPLGCGLSQTRQGLLGSRDGISAVKLFSTGGFLCQTAGQVADSVEDLALGVTRKAARWPRAARLLLPAMAEALEERPGFLPEVVIAGTTSGGMDFGEDFFRGLGGRRSGKEDRRLVRGYLPQQPVIEALGVWRFQAPVRVVSNACASGTNALCLAAGLVRSGEVESAMAIGFDALAELVFAGFDCLRASTTEKCRPFDSARSGLVLGEGAACFLIENAVRAGDRGLGRVAGWGLANDNHHLTQPNPSGIGPRLAMERALADAGWTTDTLDYINAHGTGTPFNDSSEAAAIRHVAPQVPVSSTKGMTGHALGAAGAIEAAFCLLAMQGGFLPANINLRESDLGLDIVANSVRLADCRRVLSNSFGFGGANASIALEVTP